MPAEEAFARLFAGLFPFLRWLLAGFGIFGFAGRSVFSAGSAGRSALSAGCAGGVARAGLRKAMMSRPGPAREPRALPANPSFLSDSGASLNICSPWS